MNYKNKKIHQLRLRLNDIERDILDKKNIKEHIIELEQLLHQPYLNMDVKVLLAKSYIEVNKIMDALEIYKILYDHSKSGQILINLVRLLMDIGNVDEAKEYIDNAPYSPDKSYALGFYNKRMGNYDEAIKNFKSLRYTSLEEDMLVELATTYSIIGNKEETKKIFYGLINTSKRYQAIVRLIKIALGENDPNIETLFKKFDLENCYHSGDILQYKRCLLYYQYMNGKMKNEPDNYLGQQIYNYNKERAIKHIQYKHQNGGNLYRFLKDINIEEVYNYCANNLKYIIYKEDKDHYLVELPYDVGYLMDYKTNLVEVISLSNTNKILTIYPIAKVGKHNYNVIKERINSYGK